MRGGLRDKLRRMAMAVESPREAGNAQSLLRASGFRPMPGSHEERAWQRVQTELARLAIVGLSEAMSGLSAATVESAATLARFAAKEPEVIETDWGP